jgi:hypothetical protein
MQKRNRVYRRLKAALKKQRVSRYGQANYYYRECTPQTDPRILGKVAAAPAGCGCWMCANHRQVFGVPFSETRRKLRYTGGE